MHMFTSAFDSSFIFNCGLYLLAGFGLSLEKTEKNRQLNNLTSFVFWRPLNSTRTPSRYKLFSATDFTEVASIYIFMLRFLGAFITAIPSFVPWSSTECLMMMLLPTRYSPGGKKTLLIVDPAFWLMMASMAEESSVFPSPIALLKVPPGFFTLVIPAGPSSVMAR